MSPPPTAKPPAKLLEQICWSFNRDYETLEDFDAAVLQYQIDIKDHSNGWKPEELVLPFSSVGIRWEGLDRQACELVDKYNVIESSSAEGFTALDLLFKVHQFMVSDCKGMDHCFFEGFYFEKGPDKDSGIVEYSVAQGS